MKFKFYHLVKNFVFIITISLLINLSYPISASASELGSGMEEQVLQIIRQHPEVILESIQNYQRQQLELKEQEQLSFLQSIKMNRKQFTEGSPTLGKTNSENLLIEFADFQCPYCSDVHTTLKQFLGDHQDSFTLVYKHYPIAQIHSEAMAAATASWAAHQQNKFWQYHDLLFTHQDQLGESLYLQIAKDLDLDLSKFERDRKSRDAINAIQKDMELAERLGISGTPFFVMNEETFSGAVQHSFLEDKLAGRSGSS